MTQTDQTEPRPDPRPEQARTALAEAMVELVVAEQGEIPVSLLCKQARVSRPTFYRHFHTPDDVLARAVSERLEKIAAAIPQDPDPASPELSATLTGLLAEIWEERRLYRQALRPESPYARTKLVTTTWLADTLREHAGDKLEREDCDTLVAFVAGGVLAVIASLVEADDLTREGIDTIGQQLLTLISALTD